MSADILQQPNVILAIEYLKALQKEASPITPVLLKRTDSGYHSMNLGKYSSASAIRAAYEQNGPADALRQALPEQVFQLLSQAYADCAPMKTEYFYPYMQYSLWKPRRPLHELQDITPDLCNRLLGNYKPEYTYAQYLEQVLNKQYTRTRIQRSLIHILLDITKEQVALQRSSGTMHYARVLGFRKESSALLRYLRSHSSIPLIQKAASAPSILGWENQTALQLFEQDIQASHLYEQVCYQHFHHSIYNEYTTGVIVSED
jgi:predicted nucleotidyltransferase